MKHSHPDQHPRTMDLHKAGRDLRRAPSAQSLTLGLTPGRPDYHGLVSQCPSAVLMTRIANRWPLELRLRRAAVRLLQAW
jgi:hypothetical protein